MGNCQIISGEGDRVEREKILEGGIGQGEKKILRGGNWAGRIFFNILL